MQELQGVQSKLVALELQDFMSIGFARIEFDESGILNLCGYNDSGKSAITRSLEILLYDSYANDQVNFIRDDQEFFGIGLEFSDGVCINKYKYSTGKSVWEMLIGDKMLYTNRLADGIASLTDVPEAIKNYLGVVLDETTGEQLNVRRNSDRLFLVETGGGDNYKIINSVLRSDILSESVRRLNEDRNVLQSELLEETTRQKTLEAEFAGIVVIDDETVEKVSTYAQNLTDSKKRLEHIMSIEAQSQELATFAMYDELPLVDLTRLNEIHALIAMKEVMDKPIPPECPLIDGERLVMLQEITRLRGLLDVKIPPEVEYMDATRLSEIQNILTQKHQLDNSTKALESLEQERDATLNELASLSQQHGFKICNNCGTVVA